MWTNLVQSIFLTWLHGSGWSTHFALLLAWTFVELFNVVIRKKKKNKFQVFLFGPTGTTFEEVAQPNSLYNYSTLNDKSGRGEESIVRQMQRQWPLPHCFPLFSPTPNSPPQLCASRTQKIPSLPSRVLLRRAFL